MPLDEENKNDDKAKVDEDKKNNTLTDDDIQKLAETLAQGDTNSKEFKEFERKLSMLQKKHKKKYIFRQIGLKLLYAITLFAVNLAAFGFLSKDTTIYSWQKGLIYIGAITIISIILQIIIHFVYLLPNTFIGIRPYLIQMIKPIALFMIMIIANYNLKYIVFDFWYDIIFFEILSYAFQFGITYYKYKGLIRKLL